MDNSLSRGLHNEIIICLLENYHFEFPLDHTLSSDVSHSIYAAGLDE